MGRRLVNGVDAGAVAADDRGLQYGDGLFETMAARAMFAACCRSFAGEKCSQKFVTQKAP